MNDLLFRRHPVAALGFAALLGCSPAPEPGIPPQSPSGLFPGYRRLTRDADAAQQGDEAAGRLPVLAAYRRTVMRTGRRELDARCSPYSK